MSDDWKEGLYDKEDVVRGHWIFIVSGALCYVVSEEQSEVVFVVGSGMHLSSF